MAENARRFPGPWRVEMVIGGYVVRDFDGNAIAHLYGRDTEVDARHDEMLTKDEAKRVAANIARLPSLLGA
jgi:hypothetical protein